MDLRCRHDRCYHLEGEERRRVSRPRWKRFGPANNVIIISCGEPEGGLPNIIVSNPAFYSGGVMLCSTAIGQGALCRVITRPKYAEGNCGSDRFLNDTQLVGQPVLARRR